VDVGVDWGGGWLSFELFCRDLDENVGVRTAEGGASAAVALHFHGAWQVSSGAWMFTYPLSR